MFRYLLLLCCGVFLLIFFGVVCGELELILEVSDQVIQQVYDGKLIVVQVQFFCNCQFEIVKLSGMVFYFGFDLLVNLFVFFLFQLIVVGVWVWIVEVFVICKLNVWFNWEGWWSFDVIKWKGRVFFVLFVYEFGGYLIIKFQVFQVGNSSIIDFLV